MCNSVIFVVLYCSVIDLKNADRVAVKSCYKIESPWTYFRFNAILTNIWCENQCKSVDNYRYCGTSYTRCYCRETEPSEFDNVDEDECTTKCPGNNNDMCGRYGKYIWDRRITVSKIVLKSTLFSDRISETVTEKYIPATSATTVSTRDSTMAEFKYMITSDTSSAIASKSTPYTTSQNANNDISSVMTETSTQATTGLSTETVTVTVTNKEATRTTSVSIRESTTTEFIRMITSDTSLLIVTQSTPDIIQELLSTSNENVVTATSTVMTETSTQTTTANGEWSTWNDWKFCEVNCVREDTTNGTQKRWRTCNDSKCSGKEMEERACSEPDICKGMRPRKLLCKCPKRLINTKWHFLDGMNITDAEIKKTVLEDFNKNVKSEISVNKKTVSKEIRKKNSSVDKRKSSQSIGWGCIVFLVLPMVFLMAIDILNCCIHFRSRFGDRKRNRIRPISNTQDQRDSTQPLQENGNAAESNYASRCGNNFHPDEIKRETYQRRRDENNQPGRDEWLQYI